MGTGSYANPNPPHIARSPLQSTFSPIVLLEGGVRNLGALGVVAVLGLSATAQPPTQGSAGEHLEFVEKPGEMEFSGEVIAKPLSVGNPLALAAISGYEVIDYLPRLDLYVLQVPALQSESTVAEALMAEGAFEFVEPNWELFPLAVPNEDEHDPVNYDAQYHHGVMDSELGWDLHTGTCDSVVAIIDEGIRTHPDLNDNRLESYSACSDTWQSELPPGGPNINHGSHGTRVTGAAAGTGNNGQGIVGVGWDLSHRMMAIWGCYGGNGPSPSARLINIMRGAIQAVAPDPNVGPCGERLPARVVSVSLTGVETMSTRSLGRTLRLEHDAVLVWAAGNNCQNRDWVLDPTQDSVLVVGGTNANDESWSCSGAFGTATGTAIDVVAPAVNVWTTKPSFNNSPALYASQTGTSFSTPLVAGLCALLASYDPTLSANEITSIVRAGAEDLGDPGVDPTFGYGRINVYNSLLMVATRLGAESCGTTPNSVGAGVIMEALGSAVVADNELVLRATGLPPGVSARFLIGTELVSWPSGEGYQCAGGNLVTLNPILKANEDGLVQRKVDLTSTPALGVITPGTSTVIQLWYRDLSGGPAGFNFSNSIEINWQ